MRGDRNHFFRTAASIIAGLVLVSVAACATATPETSYYRLVPPLATERRADGPVMLVEELRVDTPYDDERIAYRTTPHRLDYYEYHRWSAPPGVMMSEFLRSGYANTGEFARVVGEPKPEATVVLSGRVLALEEIDRTREHWVANVELELELREIDTGRVLWSERVHEREVLDERSPEGLARATSRALRRVVHGTAPRIVQAAQRVEDTRQAAGVAVTPWNALFAG